MAPQGYIPPAANVLGTLGTVCWCTQLIPQIWQNWRLKKTEGVPALMLLLWAISAVPFGVYAVVQNFNIPIQIKPQIFGTLSLVTWAQVLIYTSKWTAWKAVGLATGLFIIFAGIEAVLIVTLKGPNDRGLEWPMILAGSLAAFLLLLGITPPYPEIWKRRGRVVGINFVFLAMDSLGAVLSLFALVAQEHFDILGGVIYIGVIILEAGIFISHIIWLFRTRELRKQAKLQGLEFDDLPEARQWQWNPTENNSRSRSASLDTETGNPCIDQAVAETKPSEPRDSEFERMSRLKEIEKRQSKMNAAEVGSTGVSEATQLNEMDKREIAITTSDTGFFECKENLNCGRKSAELLTPEIEPVETLDGKCDNGDAPHDLLSSEESLIRESMNSRPLPTASS